MIGIYWMVLGGLVIPSRLPGFALGGMILLGLVPVGILVGFRLFGDGRPPGREARSDWTHAAAVLLLFTWPVAWTCLIVVVARLPLMH